MNNNVSISSIAQLELDEYIINGLDYIDKHYGRILRSTDEFYWKELESIAIEVFGGLKERDMFYQWANKHLYVKNVGNPLMELSYSGKQYLKSLRKKYEPINIVQISETNIIDAEFTSSIDGEPIETQSISFYKTWWKRIQRILPGQ
jgi:hypothetical protein